MNRFALIANGLVENVVLWDRALDEWQPGPEYFAVRCSDAVAPGWTYEEGVFISPVSSPAEPETRSRLSAREFRMRLTQAEQMAIRAASLVNMAVGLVYDDFTAADYIDVTNPATIDGVNIYADNDLVRPERVAEILRLETIDSPSPRAPVAEPALSDPIYFASPEPGFAPDAESSL